MLKGKAKQNKKQNNTAWRVRASLRIRLRYGRGVEIRRVAIYNHRD